MVNYDQWWLIMVGNGEWWWIMINTYLIRPIPGICGNKKNGVYIYRLMKIPGYLSRLAAAKRWRFTARSYLGLRHGWNLSHFWQVIGDGLTAPKKGPTWGFVFCMNIPLGPCSTPNRGSFIYIYICVCVYMKVLNCLFILNVRCSQPYQPWSSFSN